MTTVTETVTSPVLTLRPQNGDKQVNGSTSQEPPALTEEEYKYSHLLPFFSQQTYAPLEPFEHTDPGHRALSHPDTTSFLRNATRITEIQPVLGTEIEGVQLTELDSNGRDQLALYVARRGLVVFRDQQDFIDRGVDYYREWGRHFGRLHIHPTSGHPVGSILLWHH